MKDYKYVSGVATLELDESKCTGCGTCTKVCPHRVLEVTGGKAKIVDKDACMECGACALNCPAAALSVRPGVGCASAIIVSWFKRGNSTPSCGC